MTDNIMRHGTWWDRNKNAPLAKLMEGRFTRLFPGAPAAVFAQADLEKLAALMTADPDIPPTKEIEHDSEENPAIESIYTYFGQFIDHDLTLDPASNLREKLTPQQIVNLVDFRSPRFDLDNLYGRGPDDQPYMYQPDGIRLALGNPMSGNPHDPDAVDVPRAPNGRALIGDPRNDENRIVAQLQATMLRFHNAMADNMPGKSFDEVRQAVRWHYQWVVINDFLPTIIQAHTIREVFPHLAHDVSIQVAPPRLSIAKLRDGLELMPVEFSVAAYRFGHSMVRPIYRINETIMRRQIFSTAADPAGDLGGMRPIPADWAVDWQYFIDLDHGAPFGSATDANDALTRKPQLAYKIDTSLVNPLGLLPPIIAKNPASLALRNLERNVTFGLPSGQAVAQMLGKTPMSDGELIIGKATAKPADSHGPLADLIPAMAGNTPLWTYILAEAHQTSWQVAPPNADKDLIPIQLGPVGGHLIAEVFAALLMGDPTSFVVKDPGFTPLPELTHNGTFGLAEMINVALRRKP